MEHNHQVLEDLRAPTKDLRRAIPDVFAGFAGLHKAALADGEVSGAVKEAVATALAVANGCDGCIAYHAKGAARAGATRAEMAEILGVTLLMNGGPATVYAPRAWEAFLEFLAEVEAETAEATS